MRLASFTDYSLRVLIYLSIKGDVLSTVSEIADKYQISKNHLIKVVHNLSTMGVIESKKGKGGGIKLSLPPESINIGKLIRTLESGSHVVECLGPQSNCAIDPSCKLKGFIKIAEQQFYETLYQFTLADIVSNKNKLARELQL